MSVELLINQDSINYNINKIKAINKNIIAVVKDNAYGLGIENVLPILLKNDIHYFAVVDIDEALKIKQLYHNENTNILILGYVETNRVKELIENNIETTIFNFDQLCDYQQKLRNDFSKLKINIKVNTGMNRLGFNLDDIEKLISDINEYNLNLISVYSHISDAENEIETKKQVDKYEKILKIFDEKNIKYKYKHTQASPMLFKYGNTYNYDFARIGMAIYGLEPLQKKEGLKNVSKLVSQIINIRNVKAGEKVSYGDVKLKEDKIIAAVPIGYAHGLPKQIESSDPYVLIKGQKAYILGEVCMDMILVDVTHIGSVNIGEEVVLIGKQKESEITIEQMAKWASTIQDDIIVKLSSKIKRRVI